MKNPYELPCNIAQALNLIGDRWSLLILHCILQGHETYKDLLETLCGIPSNLLSQRLKALEADGLVRAALYRPHPPRYRYSLTPAGQDLTDIFNSLCDWGSRHAAGCRERLVHHGCGGAVRITYTCTQCGETVGNRHVSSRLTEEAQPPVPVPSCAQGRGDISSQPYKDGKSKCQGA